MRPGAGLLAALALGLSACSGGGSDDGGPGCGGGHDPTAALDTAFFTGEGLSSEIRPQRFVVTYLATESDSRCPIGVDCVRAGEAVIRVRLAPRDAQAAEVRLSTPPGEQTNQPRARHAGYEIELIDLTPYPQIEQTIEDGERCAEFVLRPASAAG